MTWVYLPYRLYILKGFESASLHMQLQCSVSLALSENKKEQTSRSKSKYLSRY